MSYVRFGPESNVYVFPHVGGGFECCGCSMGPLVKSIYTTGCKDHPLFGDVDPCPHCQGEGCEECMVGSSVRVNTRSEMIAHLNAHIKAGDKVPVHAIEALKEELKLKGEYNESLFGDGYDGPAILNLKDHSITKLTDLEKEIN
jgi:hypothetical protein